MTETDVMMKESKNSMARYYLDNDTSRLTLHQPLTFSFSLPPSFNLTKDNDELHIATSCSCISYATESLDIGPSILHWCDYLQSAFIWTAEEAYHDLDIWERISSLLPTTGGRLRCFGPAFVFHLCLHLSFCGHWISRNSLNSNRLEQISHEKSSISSCCLIIFWERHYYAAVCMLSIINMDVSEGILSLIISIFLTSAVWCHPFTLCIFLSSAV